MILGESSPYKLSPAAEKVDGTLSEVDGLVDWLTRMTPVNLDQVWTDFESGGFKKLGPLAYADVEIDLEALRRRVLGLPVHDIDDPLLETLLIEKQRELDRQLELIRMRGTEGCIMASIDLFGDVGDRMLDRARTILKKVPHVPEEPADCGAEEFLEIATAEMQWYAGRGNDFDYRAELDPNPGTQLYTSNGNLHVACDYEVPRSRIVPLIQHEIGTHTITRHNGHKQPLHVLQCGLADYDTLQEGIAVLAEYLCGYLPPVRLRVLGARVVAAHMAVHERPGEEIFTCLHEEHGFTKERAFTTAVRAIRGGGLTKDALYLKGLIELMAYLGHGGDFEVLFLGKFSLKQLPVLEKLLGRGLLVEPDLLPRYLENPRAMKRLEKVRTLRATQLYQETPES